MKASKLVAVNGGGMSYELTGNKASKVKDLEVTADNQALLGMASYTLVMELVRRHWIQVLAGLFVAEQVYRVIEFVL